MARTLLVTGASGHLGRLAVEKLLAAKTGDRVIAATRNPEKIADLAAKGAEVRKADFDDVASLDAAFKGVDRVLVISTDAMDDQGTRAKQAGRAVEAAKRAGVKHVVYTSAPRARTANNLLTPDHRATEEAIEASGLGYTINRNNIYADYLLGSMPPAAQHGKAFSAAGKGRVGHITREDCAAAAAAALAADFDGKRVLEISGEPLSIDDVVRIASEVSGKSIEVVQLPVAEYAKVLEQVGLPAPIAGFTAALDAAFATGEFDVTSSDFRTLTGRDPKSVRTLLTENRAALTGQAA